MEEVIVRFGELALKSEPVRRRFKNKLMRNLERRIEEKEIKFKIRGERGRIFIETEEPEKVSKIAANTFGVVSASPCKKLDRNPETLKEEAKDLAETFKGKEKFRIRARRSDKEYSLTSKEIEEKLGAAVLEGSDLEVDLEEPGFTIYVEVRDKNAYIFTQNVEGVGGLPEGVEGKAAAIIKGKNGIIASWLMMKRGLRIIPLFLEKEESSKLLNKFSAFEFDSTLIEKGQIETTARGKGCSAIISGAPFFDKEDLKEIKKLESKISLPVFFPLVGYTQEELSELYDEIKDA